MIQALAYGDSHAKFFLTKPLVLDRTGFADEIFISCAFIRAASIAGFRPRAGRLGVKKKIARGIDRERARRAQEGAPGAVAVILAFGQVDLELGYYYRRLVKGEDISPGDYVEWLIGIYEDFLSGLVAPDLRVLLKGVNLTVLDHRRFAIRYIGKIIAQGRAEGATVARDRLAACWLGEDGQNEMHLAFNRHLAATADRLGCGYFDLNDEIAAAPAMRSTPPRVADRFKPDRNDHHLVPSIETRKLHLGKVKALLAGD